jgi:RecA-family ATPase
MNEVINIPKNGNGVCRESGRPARLYEFTPARSNRPRPEPLTLGKCQDVLKPREWIIPDVIPRRNVTILSGDGGTGKSLLDLHLCVAATLGQTWLDFFPIRGPALYFTSEEDDDEINRRMESIGKFYHFTRRDIFDRGFRFISRYDTDPVLFEIDKHKTVTATALFDQLAFTAGQVGAVLTVIENAADVFDGDEIDKRQVRACIAYLRRFSVSTNSGVILSSHPSISGMERDTGTSGSVQWHNSVRARLYLKAIDEKDDDGNRLRLLRFMKSQYGKEAAEIRLQWRDGVFVKAPGNSSQVVRQREREDEALFLECLRERQRQGDTVRPTTASAKFMQMPLVKGVGVPLKRLNAAKERLLAASKLRIEPDGPPSRKTFKLVEVGVVG